MSALDFAQLVTYLLFLKIDDERSQRPVNRVQVVPDGLGWQSLVHKDGSALEDQFRHVLQECGKLRSAIRRLSSGRRSFVRPCQTCGAARPRFTRLMKDVIVDTQWIGQPGNAALR